MASRLIRLFTALMIAFTWCFSAATTASAASAADTAPTKFHHFKFYLDPVLLTDMAFAKAVLPKYVADMNLVLARNTSRQLVFDPNTDIVPASSKPESDTARLPLPTQGFEIWAYAVPSAFSLSYGGFATVDSSGAGVLAGMHWTRLYDPDQLAASSQAQDYIIQLDNMLHETAHMFGAGIGEYYSLNAVSDTTQAAPLLNIRVTDPADSYWSDKPDFLGDPLLERNRPASRALYLGAARYSDITATIISGDYRNGFTSFNQFTLQVVDQAGQPVSGAEVKVWNVSGLSSNPSQLLHDVSTDAAGQVTLPWGGVGSSHTAANLLRLIKVYVKGLPYTPARYVSIFDADIAQLVKGQGALIVTLHKTSQPPTDVILSNAAIDENQPAGTLVGDLGAVDADASETFSFRFCGGVDDGSFEIDGDRLLSAAPFDYERQESYSVCVAADDGLGGVLDKMLAVQVNDLPETMKVRLLALGAQDGWVQESGKATNTGGALNATATSLLVGNDASLRRYRAVLAFNTNVLPQGAVITMVTLRVRKQALSGLDPFAATGRLVVDVGKPLVGTSAALQAMDFQAGVGVPGAGVVGAKNDNQGWYTATLSAASYGLVRAGSITEMRLRFSGVGSGAALLSLYSGNAAAPNRPVLIVEYELP